MFACLHTGVDHVMLIFWHIELFKMVAISDDRIQRSAQLVADAGKEIAFGAVRAFGLVLGL